MATVLDGYVLACNKSDLPERGKKLITLNGIHVLLITCDTNVYAIEDRCLSDGRSLAHGKVLNHIISSPSSGARYDLITGQCVGGGFSTRMHESLRVFPVVVADDQVYIHL
jgi:nitrite reductase/ring-hydroxylating ferredoxin subunit